MNKEKPRAETSKSTVPRQNHNRAEQQAANRTAWVLAGYQLFAEKGYDDSSLDDLAEKAGVARSSFPRHFADKAGLLIAVLERVGAKLTHDLEQSSMTETDPILSLQAATSIILDIGLNPRHHQLLIVDGPRVLGGPRWQDWQEKYLLTHLRSLVRLVLNRWPDLALEAEAATRLVFGAACELSRYLLLAQKDDPSAQQSAHHHMRLSIERMFVPAKVSPDPATLKKR